MIDEKVREAARRITTAASYKDGVSYVYDADIQLVARALLSLDAGGEARHSDGQLREALEQF